MSLIECPECKNAISDKSLQCLKCGCPNSHYNHSSDHIKGNIQSQDLSQDAKSDNLSHIYQNASGKTVKVKQGWSWPAFLFVGLWLMAKGLWRHFFCIVFVNVLFSFLLKVMSPFIQLLIMQMADSSMLSQFTKIGGYYTSDYNYNNIFILSVLLVSIIQMIFQLPIAIWCGRCGNEWLENKLISNGCVRNDSNNSHKERQNEEQTKRYKRESYKREQLRKGKEEMSAPDLELKAKDENVNKANGVFIWFRGKWQLNVIKIFGCIVLYSFVIHCINLQKPYGVIEKRTRKLDSGLISDLSLKNGSEGYYAIDLNDDGVDEIVYHQSDGGNRGNSGCDIRTKTSKGYVQIYEGYDIEDILSATHNGYHDFSSIACGRDSCSITVHEFDGHKYEAKKEFELIEWVGYVDEHNIQRRDDGVLDNKQLVMSFLKFMH